LIILPSSEATVAKLKLKISASLSLLRANNKTVRCEREHMIRKPVTTHKLKPVAAPQEIKTTG